MDRISDMNLADLVAAKGKYWPSPVDWGDQVFYFMMVDRFSDGKEKGFNGNTGTSGTPPYNAKKDWENALATEDKRQAWMAAGGGWCGGNLKGLTGKVGYLKKMGVTAMWLSPIFKQVEFQPTYHGYGIQHYLSIDPHFAPGGLQELQDMVKAAHAQGIYVILDIILNHCGNIFCYGVENDAPPWRGYTYPVSGFKDQSGNPSITFAKGCVCQKGDAIWPQEFQDPACFTKKGRIKNWDYDPEYLEGDFEDLRDIHHGDGPLAFYSPSPALLNLCEVYKYWIAAADLDGYRIDTVKHMDPGATRYFVSAIKEFAQTIGKENFFLLGEITGSRDFAYQRLEETGLDSALGIADVQAKMEGVVKGRTNPEEYFDLFRNSVLVQKDSHIWFRDKVVTMVDDHDKVCQGQNKARFCAYDDGDKLVLSVLALNATTLGIPCIYYGTEAGADGRGGSDKYIREAMFGGPFGLFRSIGCHFFNDKGTLYKELGTILQLRKQYLPLRRGRQYLREISGDGLDFGVPRKLGDRMLSVVPWSRIIDRMEMLVAINTDPAAPRKAWVLVDRGLHPQGSTFTCIYSTDHAKEGTALSVELKGRNNDIAAVELEVPAAGFVMLK